MKLNEISLCDAFKYVKSIPNEYVDLVVSSPPYNIGKEYETRKSLDQYLEEQKLILSECVRVLKKTGSIMWQIGSYSNNSIIIPLDVKIFPILESLGLIPVNRIIWIRQHGLHARNRFSCRHETILWFVKSKDYIFNLDAIRVPQKYKNKKYHKGNKQGQLSCNPLGKNCGDIWAFQNVKHNHEEQTKHPCQFPEDMIARIILSTTNENNIVLDPYMGSGTTAIVSRKLKRKFLGSEINPEYHSISLKRLNGNPENNCFPNLKTLRDYVKQNNLPIEDFRFDVQTSKKPTIESKSNSEEFHLKEIENRLKLEERCFSMMNFLEEVYDLAKNREISKAIDIIFDKFDRLLCAGEFQTCDEILQKLDTSLIPSSLRRSFLTITAAVKDKLPARKKIYEESMKLLIDEKGHEKANQMLKRLE